MQSQQERQLLTRRSDETEDETHVESQACCKKLKKKVKKGTKKATKTVTKVGKDVGKGVVDVGNKLKDVGSIVGDGIEDVVVFAVGIINMLFGSMRWRLLTAEGVIYNTNKKLCVGTSGSGRQLTICDDGDEKTKFDVSFRGDNALFKAVKGGNYVNEKSGDVQQSWSDDSGSEWKIEEGTEDYISMFKSERSGRYLFYEGSDVTQRSKPFEDTLGPYWIIGCLEAPGSCKQFLKR